MKKKWWVGYLSVRRGSEVAKWLNNFNNVEELEVLIPLELLYSTKKLTIRDALNWFEQQSEYDCYRW